MSPNSNEQAPAEVITLPADTESALRSWREFTEDIAQVMPSSTLANVVRGIGDRLHTEALHLRQHVNGVGDQLYAQLSAATQGRCIALFNRRAHQPSDDPAPLAMRVGETVAAARDMPGRNDFADLVQGEAAAQGIPPEFRPTRERTDEVYQATVRRCADQAAQIVKGALGANSKDAKLLTCEARDEVFEVELDRFLQMTEMGLHELRQLADYPWQRYGRVVLGDERYAKELQSKRLARMWEIITEISGMRATQDPYTMQAAVREAMIARGLRFDNNAGQNDKVRYLLARFGEDVRQGLKAARQQLIEQAKAQLVAARERLDQQGIYRRHIDVAITVMRAQGLSDRAIYRELSKKYHPQSAHRDATPNAEAFDYMAQCLDQRKQARNDQFMNDDPRFSKPQDPESSDESKDSKRWWRK